MNTHKLNLNVTVKNVFPLHYIKATSTTCFKSSLEEAIVNIINAMFLLNF